MPTTRHILTLCTAVFLAPLSAFAQGSSSSSNSEIRQQTQQQPSSSSAARTRRAEAAGAAVTLETNEALFTVATGLNACGYDDDLANSNPVRIEIRADVEAAIQASPAAAKSRQALCNYMSEHQLNDFGRQVAQYVSLGLYLSPPPALAPTADQLDMPPDALQVVNVLPLLRTFAEDTALHSIWIKHRPEYEAITARVHDPLTRIILDANIYIRVPVSTYDGRTFQVLVEPMLAPSAPNARIYATDYDIVTSPDTAGNIRLEQVRHLYLHYAIEPLVYSSASSMQRLTPLLKPVQAAPLEFIYKSDIVALLTECLIKAIEARTMDTGFTPPAKPKTRNVRAEEVQYNAALGVYERQAEQVRRRQVDLDMRQGWVLTDYFYGQMAQREHDSASLKEEMGEMVYGMDVGREQHHDEQIAFLPEGSGEFVRRVRPQPTGMMLAEELMMKGDLDGARDLAQKALTDPKQDHAEAEFVVARVELMEGDPETSLAGLKDVLATSKNPRTLAWAHIYLGRLLDIKTPPERTEAIAEYKAATNVPGVQPDARAAAQAGLKTAFIVPKTTHTEEEPVDPTGKAEKDAYKPDEPDPPAKPH
ncbi:hypothetical protein [Granulicella tundricola]|uniref:hypothetical protein n=1 Tax=Granulicella tundricola TaxID=940615 RepID=UPI0012F93673|nr:hypothetical protein [Granulicella tundricola]